jgi:hypothetical protein
LNGIQEVDGSIPFGSTNFQETTRRLLSVPSPRAGHHGPFLQLGKGGRDGSVIRFAQP